MASKVFIQESLTNQCSAPGCDRGARTKGVCGKHYQRLYTHGSFDLPPKPVVIWARCQVDGCDKPSRSAQGTKCDMHYLRMRRNGSHDTPVWGEWRKTDHGYMMKRDLEHPLSKANGYLYQHRAVLFEAIGPGIHQCGWCKNDVEWGAKGSRKLVVDHLDGVKTNNARSNLMASCHTCNSSRGLFQNWVMKHQDDPFLWRLYEASQAARAA